MTSTPPTDDAPASEAPGRARWRVAGEAALIGLACAALAGPSLRTNPVGNHDVAIIASTSERMLHGDRLYTDIPHPSPPLAYLAEMVPVAVARAFGWDAMTVVQVFVLAATALCVVVTARASASCRVPEAPAARALFVVLVAAAVFGFKNYEIGQRDPMFVIACLPYLVGAAGASVGRPLTGRLAASVAVLAAAGVLIKPHFALLPLLVEAMLAVQTRSLALLLRRDALVLFGVVAGFSLWTLLGTHYVSALATFREGYVAYGKMGYSWDTVVDRVQPRMLMWAVPLLALRPGADDAGLRVLTRFLVASLAVGVFSVLIQGMGFSYHLWPVEFLAWLVVGVSAVRWWPSAGGRVVGALVAVFVAYHVGVRLNDFLPLGGDPERTFDCPARAGFGEPRGRCTMQALIDAVRAETEPGDRIAVVATTVYPVGWVPIGAAVVDSVSISPLLLGDLYAGTNTTRTPVRYHRGPDRGPLETALLRGLADDLIAHEPRVILVDHRPYLQGFGATAFDLVEFYRQDERFARVLDASYRETKPEGLNGSFRLFVRVEASGAR